MLDPTGIEGLEDALFWHSLPLARLEGSKPGGLSHKPRAPPYPDSLAHPNWVRADLQDLHGETLQGSSSTSDPNDELPKGDMEHWHPLTADGLDCGHSHPEAGCLPGTPRVMQPHVSPRPWSDSGRGVQAWWPLKRKSCHPHPLGIKQPRITDIRCPPSTTAGLDSHPHPTAPCRPHCLNTSREADGEASFVVPLRSSARKDGNRVFLALSLKREMMCVQTDVGSDTLTEDRQNDSMVISRRGGK